MFSGFRCRASAGAVVMRAHIGSSYLSGEFKAAVAPLIDPVRLWPTRAPATIGPRQRTKNFPRSGAHGMIDGCGIPGKHMPHQNRMNDRRFPLMVHPARLSAQDLGDLPSFARSLDCDGLP